MDNRKTAVFGIYGGVVQAETAVDALIGAGFFNDDIDSNSSIENVGWRYVAWVWDGANSRFYVNGDLVGGPIAHTGANTTGTAGRIGNATWASRFLRGQLDEVRFSSATHSDAWIKAEYANQRSDSTFLKALGSEQRVTGPRSR